MRELAAPHGVERHGGGVHGLGGPRAHGVVAGDAGSGEPVDAKSIKDGSTVYAWLGAQTAMTMSLPPQG